MVFVLYNGENRLVSVEMDIFFKTISTNFFGWITEHGLQVIAIVVGAFFVRVVVKVSTEKLIRSLVRGSSFHSKEAERKREDTLIRIFKVTSDILIWILAGLMILQEAGISIGPLLAAAGIAGLAFGFGGQYLIRDLISGLFIIMENQYRIGDVVCFDGTCGLVEDISMRKTTLRDMDGTVHHVPHGEIKKVSNMSNSFARVNLEIGVSYSADLDHVISVVNKVGKDLADDEAWKGSIISPPQFLRVEAFADSSVVIKILGDTQPLKQWDVSGEFRKRIKIAFDKEGIDIPFPQIVVRKA